MLFTNKECRMLKNMRICGAMRTEGELRIEAVFIESNIFTDLFSALKTAIFAGINNSPCKFTNDLSTLCDLTITSSYNLVYALATQ